MENVLHEIVPGQVRMTKNDITWRHKGVTDPRFSIVGRTIMASAQRKPIMTEPTAVSAGRSDPLAGVTGAPLKLKASCSFYTKEGSK